MNNLVKSIFYVTFSIALFSNSAFADHKGWSFELTPYAWLAGIDADITAGARTAEVDAGFDDLIDKVDLAASLLGIAQYDQWVMYGQFDYMELSEDGDLRDGGGVEVSSDFLLATIAFGYQFDGFWEDSTFDVLFGVRYSNLDNQIDIGDSSVNSGSDIFDGLVMLRPSFYLSENWRLNPVFSVGTGDSDFIYELHPQVQYSISETIKLRVGYRRVGYDYTNENNVKYDGSIHGLTIGLGGVFN